MHRAQPTLSGGYFLLVLILSLVSAVPASAQVERPASAFYGKFGAGLSDYTGDHPPWTWTHPFDLQEFTRGPGFPFSVAGEVGYAFSPAFEVGLGVQIGNYPIVGYSGRTVWDSYRYTPQLLGRYTFGSSDQRVAPYLDGGLNLTFGGQSGVTRWGGGPTLGGGVDVRLRRGLSVYVESRVNLVAPDDAIDGFRDAGNAPPTTKAPDPRGGLTGPFDAVNQLLGFGLKIDLGGFSRPRPLPDGPAPRPLSVSAPDSPAPGSSRRMAWADSARSAAALVPAVSTSPALTPSRGLSGEPVIESSPEEATDVRWGIVVGSFARGEGAQRMLQYYRNRSDSTLRPVEAAAGEPEQGPRLRIVVGRFETFEAARAALREYESLLPRGAWLLDMR